MIPVCTQCNGEGIDLGQRVCVFVCAAGVMLGWIETADFMCGLLCS